jgi:hypothetical protein
MWRNSHIGGIRRAFKWHRQKRRRFCNRTYHSEEERKAFEGYVIANPERLDSLVNASKEFEYIATENELKTSEYKKRLRIGIGLNTLLREWRENDL